MKSGQELFAERRRQADELGSRVLGWYFVIALLALGFAFALWGRDAAAQTIATDAARLTWTPATMLCRVTPPATACVDTRPIPAPPDPLSLKQTRIQRSIASTCATGAFGTVAEVWNVAPDDSMLLRENLRPAGRHCFRLAHVMENGDLSSWAKTVSKVITIPAPPAPEKSKPPTATIE